MRTLGRSALRFCAKRSCQVTRSVPKDGKLQNCFLPSQSGRCPNKSQHACGIRLVYSNEAHEAGSENMTRTTLCWTTSRITIDSQLHLNCGMCTECRKGPELSTELIQKLSSALPTSTLSRNTCSATQLSRIYGSLTR